MSFEFDPADKTLRSPVRLHNAAMIRHLRAESERVSDMREKQSQEARLSQWKEKLRAVLSERKGVINGPAIILAVAINFDIDPALIKSIARKRGVPRVRHIGFYIARKHTAFSYPMIGKIFGGRDHTTVLHGVRIIEERVAAGDEYVVAGIAAVEKLLGAADVAK